jgi:anti-anti-sigma regulatory factor
VGRASRDDKRVRRPRGAASLAQRAVAGILPGDHVCASFGSDEEHRAILGRYARQALARNERFLYLADGSDDATIRAGLAEAGIDVDAGLAQRQIVIRRLERVPKRLEPEAIIATLQADRVAARRAGYSALSGAAEMSWTLAQPADADADAVLQYEREVSRVFKTADVTGLCQYDRRLFEPAALERLVATHEFQVRTGPEGTTTARRYLTIIEREDGVVELSGALDIDAAAYLAARLAELDGDGDLVLLTGRLEFVDISGCRALVHAAEARPPGRRLVLPDAGAPLQRVLQLCGWASHERLALT